MKDLIAYSNRLTKILYGAAAFCLLLGACAGYLYQKASPQKLFSENYHPYEQRTVRGNVEFSALKSNYANGDLDSVISEFNLTKSPVEEDYLLAGIAYLEKKQPQKAIATLMLLIKKNQESKSDFFEEDAEYYLAMSYLDNKEPEKAMPYFKKIQADPDNRYHATVDEWFMLKMRTAIVCK